MFAATISCDTNLVEKCGRRFDFSCAFHCNVRNLLAPNSSQKARLTTTTCFRVGRNEANAAMKAKTVHRFLGLMCLSVNTRSSAFAPSAGISKRQSMTTGRSSSPNFGTASPYEFALLFDCDGVILETEELHRLAYNVAFKKFELSIDGKPVEWSVRHSLSNIDRLLNFPAHLRSYFMHFLLQVDYYDILQNTVGGGKPKMHFFFKNTAKAYPNVAGMPAPTSVEEQEALVDKLQEYKTNHYKTLLETQAAARPGVLELMDEAFADPTIAVGVCSAATKAAAVKTLDITLGPERVSKLDVCILGDDGKWFGWIPT